MRLRRLSVALLAVASTALLAAFPAAGKEGVTATLKTQVPLDAGAGERIRIAWTLAYDDQGTRRPFGAGGIFVRLKSASGAAAVTEYANGDRGDFSASVVVPEGGIGDVEIGLVGWQSGENGTRRADKMFPISNDPLPGDPATPAGAAGDSGFPSWVFVLAGVAAVAFAALAAALVRRRPRLRFG